jgi:TRAP-type mannitol/chloroaromatic compound transport system substrate-binding protein
MGKIQRASEEMLDLFNKVRETTSIKSWVIFEVFCNNTQKDLYKIVKATDLLEALTDDGLNFAVIFNEQIFDQLPEDMKEMVIIECIAGVSVSETDAVSLEKPNFSTYTGVLEKYGHLPIIRLHESIKSLYDAQKQKEDEEKAQKKAKRGKKKGFTDM